MLSWLFHNLMLLSLGSSSSLHTAVVESKHVQQIAHAATGGRVKACAANSTSSNSRQQRDAPAGWGRHLWTQPACMSLSCRQDHRLLLPASLRHTGELLCRQQGAVLGSCVLRLRLVLGVLCMLLPVQQQPLASGSTTAAACTQQHATGVWTT
jgi:hypothetical protein